MKYSIAFTEKINQKAANHLNRPDGQEDLCFALWYPSQGKVRLTALINTLIVPKAWERLVHGNTEFQPRYFERAINQARTVKAGLALLHSHPSFGWQDMSHDDISAEQGLAAAVLAATGLPMVGLTISSDCAWSGRFWIKTAPKTYKREWCESVRVIGDGLKITRLPTKENEHKVRPELERTVSAWGLEKQSQLENLIVGIIGTGSVGAIIGEALTRTGLKCLILLDFDSVEKANLDRLLHATRQDADLKRAKVQVMAKAYEKSSTAERFKVEPLEYSIVEEDGFKAALDCDILFSCVDRPWPRHVLNFIAYAHLIPVVDGGIAAEANTKMTGLRRADWKAHVVGPGRRCLACLGQYDPGLVSAERDGYLDDPSYIAGLPHDHSARRNENVFIFSLATAALELIHFLYLTIEPAGLSKVGAQTFHLVPSMLVTGKKKAKCAPECLFPSWEALGDRSGLTFTGRHIRAERVRAERRR